jgi:hypothetical protein
MDVYLVIRIALQILSLAIGCVGLYCFVRVILAMRENGERTLATLCLVTLLLVGIGGAIAFVYGIIKSREWELTPTMMLWGTCTAADLVLLGAVLALPVSS